MSEWRHRAHIEACCLTCDRGYAATPPVPRDEHPDETLDVEGWQGPRCDFACSACSALAGAPEASVVLTAEEEDEPQG